MTAGTFTPTDFTTQTGTAYKTAIDNNALVMKRIVDCFAPRQTTTPAMTITLDAGFVFAGTTLTEVAAQTSGTITAPVGNPRIDRAVIDKVTGALSIVTGTPNASPVAPAIPSGKVPVAQILLQTSSTTITNSMITDERVLWAVGRGLVGEMSIGQWLKDNGSGALTLNINATLQDDGAGALSTGLTTEATIASATTCNLGSAASNIIQITGTTTITSFGSSANAADPLYIVRFAAAATVQNNANIILQANVDFVATAGSFMVLKYEGGGVWREIFHQKHGVVTAGTYAAASVTVDALGNITAISAGSSNHAPDYQAFTSSGTWTKPSGFPASARVLLESIGGGGGGGMASANGSNGGSSSIGSLLVAYGGAGGGSAIGGAGGGYASSASAGNYNNDTGFEGFGAHSTTPSTGGYNTGGGGGGSGTGAKNGANSVNGGGGGAYGDGGSAGTSQLAGNGGAGGVAGTAPGGGGGGNANLGSYGAGGGGGSYKSRWVALSDMGATESIIVGAGGAGGNGTGTGAGANGARGEVRITVMA